MNFSKVKLPSNLKFGFFFTVIFLIASFLFYKIGSEIWFYIFVTLCVVFFIITIIKADILLPLNKLWMKFGILLSIIVSPIIMGIIFFGIFTPVSIIMKLLGRDELRLRFKKKKTHWIHREDNKQIDSFKNQY